MPMKSIFVVAGGPGFGKTTLVKALAAMGYYCEFDDTARRLIARASAGGSAADTGSYGLNRAVIMERVRQFERAPEGRVCFFDRGVPDSLAYMGRPPAEFSELAGKYRYQSPVFVVPPWKKIFVPSGGDTGRAEGSFAEALRIHRRILRVYSGLGYRLAEVPKTDAKDRTKFVVKVVRKTRVGGHRPG